MYIFKTNCVIQGREPEIGSEAVKRLLAQVDSYIPQPVRDLDKPFYMPIEQVFSIQGLISQHLNFALSTFKLYVIIIIICQFLMQSISVV